MDSAKGGDGEKSLSSHESQDANWGDHEPPDTKSQESENDSDYFSAEDEVEAGDYSFQRANNPKLTGNQNSTKRLMRNWRSRINKTTPIPLL